MIKVSIVCFTQKGIEIEKQIKNALENDNYHFELFSKFESFDELKHKEVCRITEELSEWTLKMQESKCAIIFVGAMGIAVRMIAKGLNSKLSDSPILVVDELGRFVIPVVGGHIGGANELAMCIADALSATPVITTATDLEGSFSIDLFAKENGLSVFNKDGIAKVSSKSLEGKSIKLSIENYPPEYADAIVSSDKRMKDRCDILLCPREYAVGVGCKKGTKFADLKELFFSVLGDNNIDHSEVGAIASIDLKANEEGLTELCRFLRIPFITYTKELLEKAEGDFSESDFVKEKTGVGNVCERAAILLTGNHGELIQRKYSKDGITIAIARVN